MEGHAVGLMLLSGQEFTARWGGNGKRVFAGGHLG